MQRVMCMIFALIWYVAMPVSAAQQVQRNDSVLIVVGLANEVEHEAWRDARVGLGLRVMLSQLFFDTGRFALREEKAEMRQRLDELSAALWMGSEREKGLHETLRQRWGDGADYAAYGRVTFFGKPRSRSSVGPMHAQKRSVEIHVEVTLLNLKTGKRIEKKGKGRSATSANSVIFEFRERHLAPDKTNIGNATKAALANAVKKVMKALR